MTNENCTIGVLFLITKWKFKIEFLQTPLYLSNALLREDYRRQRGRGKPNGQGHLKNDSGYTSRTPAIVENKLI